MKSSWVEFPWMNIGPIKIGWSWVLCLYKERFLNEVIVTWKFVRLKVLSTPRTEFWATALEKQKPNYILEALLTPLIRTKQKWQFNRETCRPIIRTPWVTSYHTFTDSSCRDPCDDIKTPWVSIYHTFTGECKNLSWSQWWQVDCNWRSNSIKSRLHRVGVIIILKRK